MGADALQELSARVLAQCPHAADSPEWRVWREQATLNLPLLVIGSTRLAAHCREHGRTRVLFLLRDGCLWHRVFLALYPEFDVRTLVSSRRLFEADEYVAYFFAAYDHHCSVIVDVYGGGNTIFRFFHVKLHREMPHQFILMDDSWYQRPHVMRRVWPKGAEHIETLNADVVGSYVDLQHGAWTQLPLEYPRELVEAAHAAADTAVTQIGQDPDLKGRLLCEDGHDDLLASLLPRLNDEVELGAFHVAAH